MYSVTKQRQKILDLNVKHLDWPLLLLRLIQEIILICMLGDFLEHGINYYQV